MKEPIVTCQPIDQTLEEENRSLNKEVESLKEENQRFTWQLLVARTGIYFHQSQPKKQEAIITCNPRDQSLEEENRLLKMEIESLLEDNERLTLQLLVKRAGF